MAIDREINSRVQAYQGNPGALQKRYAASKELIDLLALQRLKSQKDDAARQIQMEMQQMPGTIKAQREAELMGQSVQELAKRTGDTMRSMGMKKKMAAQNKAMGKRAQGLASLTGNPMGQQNRPQQPLRMQAGGIVGFNGETGNLVTTEVKRKIQELINLDFSDEEIKEILSKVPEEAIKKVRQQQREDMRLSADDGPGPMEEVVVTAPRLSQAPVVNPLSAKGMMQKQGEVKQTKDKNLTEIPAPVKMTPERSAPPKSTPKKPEGVVETLFGEQGFVLPLGLEKNSGTRDRVQYAIDTNKPLSGFSTEQLQSIRSDNDQYTPKIEAELARRESKTSTQQQTPPKGIASIAKDQSQESFGVLRSDGSQQSTDSMVDQLVGLSEPKKEPKKQNQIGEESLTRVRNGKAEAIPQLQAEEIDTKGSYDEALELLKKFGLDPDSIPDPQKQGISARDEAAKYLGEVVGPDGTKTTKDAEMREYLRQLQEIDKRQQDPRKLRQERINALLSGRGLGGSGRARSRVIKEQDQSERDRQLKQMELLGLIQDRDTAIRESATQSQRAREEQIYGDRRSAAQTMASMSNAEIQRRTEEAKMRFQANQSNASNKLKRLEIDALNNIRMLDATDGSIADKEALLAKTRTALAEARLEFMENDQNLQSILRQTNLTIQSPKSTDQERQEAQVRQNAAKKQASLDFEIYAGTQHTELMRNLAELERELTALRGRRAGFTEYIPSSPDAESALERNLGG